MCVCVKNGKQNLPFFWCDTWKKSQQNTFNVLIKWRSVNTRTTRSYISCLFNRLTSTKKIKVSKNTLAAWCTLHKWTQNEAAMHFEASEVKKSVRMDLNSSRRESNMKTETAVARSSDITILMVTATMRPTRRLKTLANLITWPLLSISRQQYEQRTHALRLYSFSHPFGCAMTIIAYNNNKNPTKQHTLFLFTFPFRLHKTAATIILV